MEIPVIRNVLEESEARAKKNRSLFDQHGIMALNLMSSPGAGKTTLLSKTIPLLQKHGLHSAVIEGDITSTIDSERLAPLGIPIVQANTEPFGGDCHVGAHLVQAALEHFDLPTLQIVFIENIGNLVCRQNFIWERIAKLYYYHCGRRRQAVEVSAHVPRMSCLFADEDGSCTASGYQSGNCYGKYSQG